MPSSRLRVACIQLNCGLNPSVNIATASSLIQQAAADGSKLISTPEMTSIIDKRPGSVIQQANAEANDTALNTFRKLAKSLDITLHIGSLPIRVSATKCANRAFVIAPNGEIISRYDKIHMFDVSLSSTSEYRESNEYLAGNDAVVSDIGTAKLGLTVCYDVRFPALYCDLALAGADIMMIPAAFTHITGQAHWQVLLRARAIETGSFVIAAAQTGQHEDGRRTWGHSMIVDPWGSVLADAGQEPGYIATDIDLNMPQKVRAKIPNLQHIRAFNSAPKAEQ